VSSSPRTFERTGAQTLFSGRIFDVVRETFRFADGAEVERDIVRHPGAVAVVAVDDEAGVVYLVRQPREAVGDPDVLELPAGRLDKEGEEPEASARRELAEEIGKAAGRWELLHSYWSSVGALDETVHVFLAEELSDEHAESGEDERIEIVPWPLADLDAAIAEVRDAKTLIGLMALRDRRRSTAAG
jgi:ADP-ribose pyrophosphatase